MYKHKFYQCPFLRLVHIHIVVQKSLGQGIYARDKLLLNKTTLIVIITSQSKST
jgi:hypothetical protein